jgi:ABC-type dipeptide/oligopeptide/nickel transport system permease component
MIMLILRRLVVAVPVAFVSTILVFLVIHAAPGDPAQTLAGPDASPAVVQAVRARLGLNESPLRQYFGWLGGIFRGDLGRSYASGLPATQLLPSRITASLELVIAGALIAIVMGLILGGLAGIGHRRLVDRAISAVTGVMSGTPEFWFGLLIVLVFSIKFGWFPPAGRVGLTESVSKGLGSLILPALAIALHPTAIIARSVRASVIDTLGEEYIRTAQAKGATGMWLYSRHVLRNSLLPIIAVAGVAVTRILGGTIVVESVFAWPGLGLLLVNSITGRDYQMVQAVLLIFAIAVILINLIADCAYAIADPRIRASAS